MKELYTKLESAVKEQRGLIETIGKNEPTEEQRTSLENMDAAIDKLTNDLELAKKAEERNSRNQQLMAEIEKNSTVPVKETPEGDPKEERAEQYRGAFRNWMRGGTKSLAPDDIRALSADNDIYGGYISTPQQVVNELIKNVDNETFMMGLSTVFRIPKAESLGNPTLDNDPADPVWTSEIGTGDEDSTMSFGKRELRPHPLAKRIKVSNKLLRAGMMNVETLITERLGYKFAITEENAFLNGTGANQPLGLFTASDNGIPSNTTYDISSGNTTTELTGDGLINAKYAMKSQYWTRARWMFHRDAMKQIRKLKTGDGQYIWQPGLSADTPDRILEIPYIMSEYVPNTFTTGQYVGILGDFSKYYIAIALDMVMQRLDELYAETNQVGFIGRLEVDGMPVLPEAFRRITLA